MSKKTLTGFEHYSGSAFMMAEFTVLMMTKLYPVLKELEKTAPRVEINGEGCATFPDDILTHSLLFRTVHEKLSEKAFSTDTIEDNEEEDAYWAFCYGMPGKVGTDEN